MGDLDRDELYHALSVLSKSVETGFEGVNRRLDTMNGQVRLHGEEIAVLKDRGNRDGTARGAGLAGLITAVATFIWQKFYAP